MGLESPSVAEHFFRRERQREDVAQIHYYVARCGWVAFKSQSPFLGVVLDGGLL